MLGFTFGDTIAAFNCYVYQPVVRVEYMGTVLITLQITALQALCTRPTYFKFGSIRLLSNKIFIKSHIR
jgi:hypothetical protein